MALDFTEFPWVSIDFLGFDTAELGFTGSPLVLHRFQIDEVPMRSYGFQ